MKLRIFAEDKPAQKVFDYQLELEMKQSFYRQHFYLVPLLYQACLLL